MEELKLFKDAYFTKSFYSYGRALDKCFDCSYCRVFGDDGPEKYEILPTDLNPMFINFPVAVNLMYGDPLLQLDHTIELLHRLEDAKHKGPVIIITKGDISKFPTKKFELDLHIGFSTFGLNSKYDGGKYERFLNNLKVAKERKYHFFIEFRPIIRDINDSDEIFDNLTKLASQYNVPMGYSGLQVSDTLAKHLKDQGIEFKPYDGHKFGLKKFISKERENSLREFSHKNDCNIFRKTSCLLTYQSSVLLRDPNAHYYRPNEIGCYDCPMQNFCFAIKDNNDKMDRLRKDINLPFNWHFVDKKDHVCGLFKNGLCKFPSHDCTHISGRLIEIPDQTITTTDVRIIKWLTGYTVVSNFIEVPYMSMNWLQK